MALISTSYAAVPEASSQLLVQDGRDLAFNGGVPTIAGLLAADLKFQEALENDPYNQQAIFFRAITRVLVSVAQQGGSIGLFTLPDIMEALGFSWNGSHPPPTDPANPSGDDLLTSLEASLQDLTKLDDTFTVTLMSNQDHNQFPQITVTYDDALVLISILETAKSFLSLPEGGDIFDQTLPVMNDSMGLTDGHRILLYQFLTPFGYSAIPGAPTIGTAVRGNASVKVAFTIPSTNGGSAITNYTATSTPGGKTGTSPVSPITVGGLANGTVYTFTIRATNAVGTGPSSAASNSVTPATVPGAPTIGGVTRGNARAKVAFTAPRSNGGSSIIRYTATSAPGGKTGSGTTSPITVSGLTNGTTYKFTVKATNSVGVGPASAISAGIIPMTAPATVPSAPKIGIVTRGNASAKVAFTAPSSNGGSSIIRYTATSAPGGKTGSGTASPIIVSGLTNGKAYTFTVKAKNSVGVSPASAVSKSIVPATVPSAPKIGTVTRGNASAKVAFTAPSSNGGSAIIRYIATSAPGGKTGSGTASPIIVSGLTNGQAYTFTVKAKNSVGVGPASAVSKSIIPSP
ncbi:MAG: fibronectin type III domain-containing protein [Desulfobulbaceae bacterium]|nr:fibronectin type III domain-containing protein [Desulfobulbaceae bacterium]